MLGSDIRNKIDNYIMDVSSREFLVMDSLDQVKKLFEESLDDFLESLSSDELFDLRSYTGYNYKDINAVMRRNWSYDKNGFLDQQKNDEIRALATSIEKILNKFVIPEINFVAFRGRTISSFSSYGIMELSQLENLKGKFMYEPGFTSTSIIEESSYINKKLDDGRLCNVGIRYLIPSECNDGALLISDNTSYSVSQNEFLLNKGSLSKVIDVSIDVDSNSAILTVILIPKKIYDLGYRETKNSSRVI